MSDKKVTPLFEECPWDQLGVLLYENPGEVGRFLPSDEFGRWHPTMQLDVLQDWIAELQEEYQRIYDEQDGGAA